MELQTDLLVIGNSIITGRHHVSSGTYEPNDPQNQVGGIIPVSPLSGWRRHGMERVIYEYGSSTCHSGEADANFRKTDVYEHDLNAGYHEKGTCVSNPAADDGCVVFDLLVRFGNVPGIVMRRPITFTPVRSKVDYTRERQRATIAV